MWADEIGKLLAAARSGGRRLSTYPDPAPGTIEDGYAIQDALIRAMGNHPVGWKVGATSQTARDVMGVDEPFAGPVFETDLQDSPARLTLAETDLRIVEAEIGFRLATDLPARDAAYRRSEVTAAIATVHPVFEIVNKRLPGGIQETVPWAIADGALHQALVIGAGTPYAPSLDLAAETVAVSVDGVDVTSGTGANAMGDPVAVLLWLINSLSARGRALRAGDTIASGLIADVVIAEPGQAITAKYPKLGQVSLRVV